MLILHLRKQHSIILKPRENSGNRGHRPTNKYFCFVNNSKRQYDVERFGCPSCWFHCQKMYPETFERHIISEHLGENIKEEETYDDDYENEEEENVGSSTEEFIHVEVPGEESSGDENELDQMNIEEEEEEEEYDEMSKEEPEGYISANEEFDQMDHNDEEQKSNNEIEQVSVEGPNNGGYEELDQSTNSNEVYKIDNDSDEYEEEILSSNAMQNEVQQECIASTPNGATIPKKRDRIQDLYKQVSVKFMELGSLYQELEQLGDL